MYRHAAILGVHTLCPSVVQFTLHQLTLGSCAYQQLLHAAAYQPYYSLLEAILTSDLECAEATLL